MKTSILFGGAGYIGSNLVKQLLEIDYFDKIIICDLNPLLGFDKYFEAGKIEYIKVDVRDSIDFKPPQNIEVNNSWIFNFAAVHREPGHQFHEYFDTNVPGAENINEFARRTGIKKIFFTSSIAPYGKSLNERTENSPLYPETAYGISKALAEKIHQEWLAEDKKRRLIIVRPSVIFGPRDPGNVHRMIIALKKGTFVLPNGGNIVKSYGYVFGLIESILFTMKKNDRLIIYNYAENQQIPLKEMASIIKEEFGYKKPTLKLPVKILAFIAFCVEKGFKITGKKSDIHPVRVRKAGFPTNIKSQYLINNGFEFRYDFRTALKHWKAVSPSDFN